MAFVSLTAGPVSADVFTRRSDRGVLEATDSPEPGQGFKLAYKSKGVVIHSAAFRAAPPNAARFEPFVQEAAAREGVSPDLVWAVIRTESAFDHLAVSSAGARGLMQLMPDAARRFGVKNAFDPRDNIGGGVRYLRVLLGMFHGDVALAVAAYNAGEGAVMRYGGVPPYRETRDYVRKILGLVSQGTGAPAVIMASYVPGDAAGHRAVTGVAVHPPRILYRWRGADGVMHMTDTPPVEPVRYERVRSAD